MPDEENATEEVLGVLGTIKNAIGLGASEPEAVKVPVAKVSGSYKAQSGANAARKQALKNKRAG